MGIGPISASCVDLEVQMAFWCVVLVSCCTSMAYVVNHTLVSSRMTKIVRGAIFKVNWPMLFMFCYCFVFVIRTIGSVCGCMGLFEFRDMQKKKVENIDGSPLSEGKTYGTVFWSMKEYYKMYIVMIYLLPVSLPDDRVEKWWSRVSPWRGRGGPDQVLW